MALGSPSVFGGASADGRFVSFMSLGMAVAGTDLNESYDVFLYDRQANGATLVSHLAGQPLLAGPGHAIALSDDGRYALWASAAESVFVPGVTSVHYQLYLWDRETASHRLVSRGAGSATEAGDNHSFFLEPDFATVAMSTDGRRVLFASWAANLVPGDSAFTFDLFLFDAADGLVRLVSHPPGQPGNFVPDGARLGALSAQGRFAAFQTLAPWPRPPQLYRWDAVSGDTVLVVAPPVEASVELRSLSADGRSCSSTPPSPISWPA